MLCMSKEGFGFLNNSSNDQSFEELELLQKTS